ncbi:MAG: phosphatase PAP2 family protein [Pseudonocardiaceae bacterium]|nr:phosphatase PAP2 family protein [Pseudonocardiaceae bacterium]
MLEKNSRVAAETMLLCRVQDVLAKPVVVRIAQGMSVFGEHSAGWLALGAIGVLVDRKRRKDWIVAAGGVFAAHAASVAVKRVVKRQRPADPNVRVLVGTPSRLSFPSAHATSTTAAAVLYGGLIGRRLEPVLVPPMLASRMVLGVHYPSDVLVGSALGATIGGLLRRRLTRGKRLRRSDREQ